MRAEQIDPRDQTHETVDPTYRVFFWRELEHPGAWESDEWELSETDAPDVFVWADGHADGRLVSVWAVTRPGDHVEHIRLLGTDPVADDTTWPGWANTHRPEG